MKKKKLTILFASNLNVNVREAVLYTTEREYAVCNVCENRCRIKKGKLGKCKTKINIDGKLFTRVYGVISSLSANPIEKKPLFHFYPGTKALTAGSFSCNFTCPWCQNWEISKNIPEHLDRFYISPERFIRLTETHNCSGTSISFNEPVLSLEYSADIFTLARRKGYYNTFVTNGFMTSEALEYLYSSGLDAMNIDLKGDVKAYRICGGSFGKVLKRIRQAVNLGIHVEVTTLVIPGLNDDERILRKVAKSLVNNAGENTPWHVTRFFPAYKSAEYGFSRPTPVITLEKAREIGVEEGIRYVYVGNVPGHKWENTYCPECGTLLIERYVFDVIVNRIKDRKCPRCSHEISGRFGKK